MSYNWKEPETAEDVELFRKSSAILMKGSNSTTCPLCKRGEIRFYCHRFSLERPVGTIWIWCPKCKVWTHSRTLMTAIFQDPFAKLSRLEMSEISGEGWMERLNQLWEDGKIPHQVVKLN